MRPAPGTYIPYFDNYIRLVPENDLLTALGNNRTQFLNFLKQIPAQKENYAYAPGKWSVKEVINHVIDTERIFAFRALSFARRDIQKLTGFEEDDYANASRNEVYNRSKESLMEEFDLLRQSNLHMFKSFSQAGLEFSGNMAAGPATALALGYCICGHSIHHLNVIREKYL